jgi:dTDP-4-dehydrorhamnose reductase
MPTTILVTGKNGQVGNALLPLMAAQGNVVAVDLDECDLADAAAVTHLVRTVRPGIIVNPAAYTAVDKAESNKAAAFAVNAAAPGVLAEAAKEIGAALIHYSTDYVFDGRKSGPYVEDDATNPLSVYGASKRDGEVAVRSALHEHLILRTSWVFGAHGANFLKTMIRLAGERDELAVVADQFGAPTSAALLAQTTAQLVRAIRRDRQSVPFGTYHLTPSGRTSWHGFAAYAIEYARSLGMPIRIAAEAIRPIPATAYPAPAARPANSCLDTGKIRANFGIDLPPWQDGVRAVLEALARA